MERICKKCGIEKPLDEFEKAKKCALGRTYRCKKCRNKSQTSIKQCKACGKPLHGSVSVHLEICKECNHQHVKEYKSDWYIKNKVRELLRSKAYRDANKEQYRIYKRKFKKKQAEILGDTYVKGLRASWGMKWEEIPKELIEIKRLQLTLKRMLKNGNQNAQQS